MGSTIIVLILLCIVFYFLYINGYMVMNAKRAITFIGSIRGKGTCSASFHACSGYMKRMMRFKENGAYQFVLEANLVNGELEVEILDKNKQVLMHLDKDTRQAEIEADCKARYTLIFRFQSASGDYRMNWNRID